MMPLSLEKKPDALFGQEPLVLVCAADNLYAMPLAVTVRSALENLKSDQQVILFILDGGIKDRNKRKILNSLSSEKCEVTFLSVSGSLVEGVENRHFETGTKHLPIVAYYRLLIPDLLPDHYEKVVYLDCDLVVKGDLGQLWQINLEEHYALAVQDMWTHSVSHPAGLLNYQALGIPSDAKYFNSGVLVINLKKWRADQISAKAIDYLQHNREYVRWHDQDVLNALLAGQWGELDPRWNVNIFLFSGDSAQKNSPFSDDVYNDIIRDPYIIHFTSGDKPWVSPHAPCNEHFFHFVDLTSWSGWRPTRWTRLWMKLVRKVQKITLK